MLTPEKPRTTVANPAPLFALDRFEEAGLRVVERRYEPAWNIFMAGDPADKLYLLTEGIVRVCKDYGNYSQATVALLKDSGSFGEFDLSGTGRQRASAQAMTECRVASIRTGDLRLAMERHPKLAVELFAVFSEKLRHSEQTMEILLYREVSARLASLMPMLTERFGEYGEDGAGFTVPFTHGELAEMIACSREAVSKALGELRREGFIELERRKIKITDHAGLREHAKSSGASLALRGSAGTPRSLRRR